MKIERKRNLKGAVLFTVVSVLAIMIIFMTCTLAMASAANKRARKSYSTSQSTYTARATIDSILATVGTNKEFSAAVRQLAKGTVGDTMNVGVEFNDASLGTISNVTITYVGKKNVYDPEDKETWVERNLFEISADITLGGETTTIKSNILQDPPQPGGKGAGGAAFLTYGAGIPIGNFTSSWGGTYFGMGEWSKDGAIADKWNNMLKYNNWSNGAPAEDGDMSTYGDGRVTFLAEKGYLTGFNYQYNCENTVETPMVVNGNFKMVTRLDANYAYHASGTENPGIQVWGDLDIGDSRLNVTASDSLKAYYNGGGSYDFYDMPYVYVDGKIHSTGAKIYLGTGGAGGTDPWGLPLNIICGYIETPNSENNIYGDIYCMDADKTSKFNGNQNKLYQWVSSTVGGTDAYSKTGGNIYSKGNVEVNCNLTVPGEFRVEGDLTVNGNLDIDGILVVGGKIIMKNGNLNAAKKATVPNGHSGIYADAAEGGKFSGSGDDLKFDGKTVDSTAVYLAAHSGEKIYPAKAEREALMGVSWMIKGIDGHVIAKPDDINLATFAKYDMTGKSGMPAITKNTIVTGVCKAETLRIEAGDDDVYVLLQDVNFQSSTSLDPDDETNTKTISDNNSKIEIVEKGTGRVFIMFGGIVTSNYDYSLEANDEKLIKTVFDWMTAFGIEKNNYTEQSSAVTYNDGYSGGTLTITQNTKLTGNWGAGTYNVPQVNDPIMGDAPRDIIVKAPATGSIQVVLENVTANDQVRFVVDDSAGGTVNFYIKGKNELHKSAIVPESFRQIVKQSKDTGKPINIIGNKKYKDQFIKDGDLIFEAPKINIYSEPKKKLGDGTYQRPSLTFDQESYIVGYVLAQDLVVDVGGGFNTSIVKQIRYDGVMADPTGRVGRFGVIGMLDAYSVAGQNNWLMFYVDNSGDYQPPIEDAEGKHTYAAVEYYAYVN